MNENARKHDQEELALDDISLKYPELHLPETGSTPVTISTPCELTLILHTLQQSTIPKPIEIGVSRRLCWLCQRFVESLVRNTNHPIVYSEKQGKIHAGWAMPPGAPDKVENAMRELIEWEISDIRETILARHPSDTFPNDD